MRASLVACGLLVAVAFPASAVPPSPSAEPIPKLIADLGADDFRTRDAATKALLDLEGRALGQLKQALTADPTPEVALRIRHLLRRLAIHEPGGEIVNGLKLRLTADRDAVCPGDTVTLTTTLCNMTGRDLNVQVAFGQPNHLGNDFTDGAALHRVGVPQVLHWRNREERSWSKYPGLCGNGMVLHYVTLPAKSARSYEAVATLGTWKRKTVYFLGEYHAAFLEVPPDGVHTLRMVHWANGGPEQNQYMPLVPSPWEPQSPNAKAPFWGGEVRSNDVRIRVIPRGVGGER